jgi:S-methylmethionine-dependent homocysteine/selenocysteine methylase
MTPVVISGCVGPRGDGYRPDAIMTPDQARDYHSGQVRVFAETDADLVTGITMTYPAEAVGLVEAARSVGIPVVVSFTVETDGRLPTGQTLAEAVETVDAATQSGPAYYMVNCAHPTHFADALAGGAAWTQRLRGVRANASKRSHAELDEAAELDAGNPVELARDYLGLRATLPRLTVLGGCCGTSHEHVGAISAAVVGTP